jgi:hypothetical protein
MLLLLHGAEKGCRDEKAQNTWTRPDESVAMVVVKMKKRRRKAY